MQELGLDSHRILNKRTAIHPAMPTLPTNSMALSATNFANAIKLARHVWHVKCKSKTVMAYVQFHLLIVRAEMVIIVVDRLRVQWLVLILLF